MGYRIGPKRYPTELPRYKLDNVFPLIRRFWRFAIPHNVAYHFDDFMVRRQNLSSYSDEAKSISTLGSNGECTNASKGHVHIRNQTLEPGIRFN